MSEIQFGKTVSLSEAEDLIINIPENRFHLEGEPGIGKSSMLKRIGERTGLPVAYIDVPNMDLGDIAMPVVDHTTKTTKYYPNARFMLERGEPVCIMLDEFSKGPKPVVNMLHPLLEVMNPRLGDVPVPTGSRIFTTGNMGSDGVGDNLPAHTRARLTTVRVRKPSSEQWIEWAIAKGSIAPEIIAWVNRFPQVLASYLDGGAGDNPYIYNPRTTHGAYVCPRTLELASNIVVKRSMLSTDSVIAALTGVIGEAGARDMQAFIAYADQLPSRESIKASPKTAQIPTMPGACAVTVFSLIASAERDTMTPYMEYLERFEPEWQATFAINLVKNVSKQAIAFSSQAFTKWMAKNQDLL